ncbi:putative tetratricopeptide-like helical domain superfamily [Dioscorea sansibarensis]
MAASARAWTTTKPSSQYIQRILDLHRNEDHLPRRIWHDDPPFLHLPHRVLHAIDSSPNPSPLLDQALAHLFLSGLSSDPFTAGRAIKKLSSSPSSLSRAISLYSSIPNPDAFLCNTILRALLNSDRIHTAFSFYSRSLRVSPNHFTFPLLCKLFAELGYDRTGRCMHTQALKLGFDDDLFVRNAMIHMYSCFGDLAAARRIFGLELCTDLVTWNSMISAYVKNGTVRDAQEVFDQMPERDVGSWNVMIAGHAVAGEMENARKLFDEMPERDVVSWNTLINGYASAGQVEVARQVFDAMPERNSVSWTVMLTMYARMKNYRECLKVFDGMMAVGDARPDEAALVSVLTACANLTDLSRGRWVHSLIADGKRRIELDVLLSTALLTMYAKCGVMDEAKEVFDRMEDRSVVSWNSMISGYGVHGQGRKAMEMFMEMERWGPSPNETTFVCLLSACAHSGMVLEGWWCFNRMIRVHRFEPKVEHFGCMMDLLGRAGLVDDSERLADKMKVEPAPAIWGALLSATKSRSGSKLGEIVSKKLIELQPGDMGPYVLLSNIYAEEGKWDDVEKVREVMAKNGLQKPAGVSKVECDPLVSDEASVSRRSMMYSLLEEMGAHLKSSSGQLVRQRQASL